MEIRPLNEEQRLLRDTIRRMAEERVRPRAAEIDATAEYPQDMFDLLREMGLFALPFPKEYGGAASMVSACLAVEELARVCYNTAYLLVVQWSGFGAILASGDDAQKARLLPGLVAGDLRAAIAVTEPGTGSDVAGIQTRAEKCDGGYALTGGKIYCTNARHSDFIIVAARSGGEAGHRGIGAFIVERGAVGFTIARDEVKMGARGIPSSELRFDKAFVPVENRLGPEDGGFKAIMAAFNRTRPVIGARGTGLALGAMELAADYAKERMAFGQPVSDFQGVRWMLADMAMRIEAARGLVYRAASAVDRGVTGMELARLSAMAKCMATDAAMQVATDAVQIFGAAGVSKDVPIERYMRDAKVLQIVEGTNQIQRNIVADALLGRAARR
ncbi:MAG: acyl-CoA dehydrogenase family protein [Alphaproteobacteria bacterium]|nr:acyl-CoA dehydrogenase family protein [Alphaproteobacteria bacterium]